MPIRKTYPISPRILKGLDRVEHALGEVAGRYSAPLSDASALTISAGGKRLRPALVLIAGQAGEYDLDRLVPVAVACELIHTATLVHDDVLDQADKRRGRPTVNSRWGRDNAIATGDVLFGQAFQILAESADARAIQMMAETSLALSLGELAQQEATRRTDDTVEACLSRVKSKTAVLFAACCELGALAGRADEADAQRLEAYGLNLGMAFQIFDDVLDLTADERVLGKPIGTDLRDGTITLPILYGLEALKSAGDAAELERLIKKGEPDEIDVRRAIELIVGTDAIDRSRAAARGYVDEAGSAIDGLSNAHLTKELTGIGQFVLDRNL